jgi:hypothetical protein
MFKNATVTSKGEEGTKYRFCGALSKHFFMKMTTENNTGHGSIRRHEQNCKRSVRSCTMTSRGITAYTRTCTHTYTHITKLANLARHNNMLSLQLKKKSQLDLTRYPTLQPGKASDHGYWQRISLLHLEIVQHWASWDRCSKVYWEAYRPPWEFRLFRVPLMRQWTLYLALTSFNT